MYIEPRTNVKILHNVPLDDTYDHTLYFANTTDQYNYFANLTKKNCVNYTYQRVNKGRLRIEGKADNYYDCNYMMFQNTSFGNKWFYAFIKSVEYINNETTEIEFEIDVIQTWLFDCQVEECFIERQHSLSDAIGDNIVPEPVDCGEYVFNNYEPVTLMNEMCICVAIVDVSGQAQGQLYDGIYGGAKLFVYSSSDVSGVNNKIDEYIQQPDAILGIYMFPKILIGSIPVDHIMPYGASAGKNIKLKNAITKNDTLDGYLPKNGKMYTYPYNYFHVDNASGSDLALRYEFFENLQPVVEISGTITQPVNLTLRPASYKGMSPYSQLGGYTTLNTEVIELSSYPICSWNVDSYEAWVAQNSIPLGGRILTSALTSGLSSALNPIVGGINIASNIANISNALTQWYQASIQADMCKGNFNNGGVNTAIGKQQFYSGRRSVCYQYAKIIDDFFNMYGYAHKCVGRLNTHSRPHWNYVKTIGCVLTGSVPADDTKKIASIYDRGITFWRYGNEVGNYELDNRPS